MKTVNPYNRLLDEIKRWVFNFKNRRSVTMFHWPKEKMKPETGWRLDDVYQRVLAADALGYEVVFTANERGMEASYRKKPKIPWQWEQ